MMSTPDENVPNAGSLGTARITSIDRLILTIVRAYTFNTPIDKGKYRLFQLALSSVSKRPRRVDAVSKDGRRFIADLTTGMQEQLYFLGQYEPFLTEVMSGLIRPGDVCIDAGANFGWYTTLMAAASRESGEVHAFEPIPSSFELLAANRELSPYAANISANNVALGDELGEITINLFADLPSGHASAAIRDGGQIESITCPLTTLDDYLKVRNIDQVDVIKADVEGSELMFVNGGASVIERSSPIILMEMALEQSEAFGYRPDDLLKRLRSLVDYRFFKADEIERRLIEVDKFAHDDIGANVFCIPINKFDRIAEHTKRSILTG